MSRKPTSETTTPAAQLEMARAELEQAQQALGALDIHKGALNEAATRRRELSERIEIARERLQVAQDRFDEYEYGRIEGEIVELQGDAAQLESELALAREQAEADLRQHLNGDWLSGQGRFASCPPAIHGLLGYCNSVNEIEGRRDAVLYEMRRLENRIRERRAARDREAAAERFERRKRIIAGEVVEVALDPWRIELTPGYVQAVMDGLDLRAIPAALVDPHHRREAHLLLPPETTPHRWIDSFHFESAARITPRELCPALAGVYTRAIPPKKSGAKAGR